MQGNMQQGMQGGYNNGQMGGMGQFGGMGYHGGQMQMQGGMGMQGMGPQHMQGMGRMQMMQQGMVPGRPLVVAWLQRTELCSAHATWLQSTS